MNPFKLAPVLCLALAILLVLGACHRAKYNYSVVTSHQHWTVLNDGEYLELHAGRVLHSACWILQENVSKQKHSSRSEHNPDYDTDTFVVTSNSAHYPGKSGDKFCEVHEHISSYVQTKENEFIIQASMSDHNEYGAAQIDYAALESQILFDAAALGRYGNFKYGVFDNTEERTQEAESQVTGTTSRTTGSETGMVTPIYKSTYGVRYGNESTTTSVDRTPNSITVNRKHFIRFYNSEPDTDGYFDVALILKSLGATDSFKVLDQAVPNGKYCSRHLEQCGYMASGAQDFTHTERR